MMVTAVFYATRMNNVNRPRPSGWYRDTRPCVMVILYQCSSQQTCYWLSGFMSLMSMLFRAPGCVTDLLTRWSIFALSRHRPPGGHHVVNRAVAQPLRPDVRGEAAGRWDEVKRRSTVPHQHCRAAWKARHAGLACKVGSRCAIAGLGICLTSFVTRETTTFGSEALEAMGHTCSAPAHPPNTRVVGLL